ncbi:septum formation protein [Mariprofundus micogutta]|uniref:dTTP/UTP pyrophosphatase n=1 Tax=Mariprofundus micogutta TaxID=1921010 RepID=A0A1L8CQV0_9PROT|nr:Maf family protein [Mariprofundus micogutta]GAV21264.1 septum formation protein [Mariprofundus micogutta]
MLADMEVILASRSPRRLMLLQSAGLAVEVRPSHIDETPLPGETVAEIVARLGREKAMACEAAPDIPVIAADTLVAINGKPLGQPADLAKAKAMLMELSGNTHHVFTGVTVRLGDRIQADLVQTRVVFRQLSSEEIDTYLAHNEVLDKAGSYAIQGGAASFIEAIEGPLDNVIGLPVRSTLNILAKITFSGTTT